MLEPRGLTASDNSKRARSAPVMLSGLSNSVENSWSFNAEFVFVALITKFVLFYALIEVEERFPVKIITVNFNLELRSVHCSC